MNQMSAYSVSLLNGRCIMLPDDWLAFELVSFASTNAPGGWAPIRYKSQDEFFNLTDRNAWSYYTIQGREVLFGGTPDDVNGLSYRIAYFAEVPVFADSQDSWVYNKYPSLYLIAALMHADLHAVGEEDKALALKAQVSSKMSKIMRAVSHCMARRVARSSTRYGEFPGKHGFV